MDHDRIAVAGTSRTKRGGRAVIPDGIDFERSPVFPCDGLWRHSASGVEVRFDLNIDPDGRIPPCDGHNASNPLIQRVK